MSKLNKQKILLCTRNTVNCFSDAIIIWGTVEIIRLCIIGFFIGYMIANNKNLNLFVNSVTLASVIVVTLCTFTEEMLEGKHYGFWKYTMVPFIYMHVVDVDPISNFKEYFSYMSFLSIAFLGLKLLSLLLKKIVKRW